MNEEWMIWFQKIDKLLMQHYRVMQGSGQGPMAVRHLKLRRQMKEMLAEQPDGEPTHAKAKHKDPLKALRNLPQHELLALASGLGVTLDKRWKRETFLQKLLEAQKGPAKPEPVQVGD